MTIAPKSLRRRLLLAGACGIALSSGATTVARADASSAQVNLGLGQAGPTQSESVIVKYKARLLKEKNASSAVTELGQKQIASVGIAGSTAELLRQAPSVYVYQQGLGDNAPELTVRGIRGLEVAQTLDGIPIQDLEAPGSFYLSNNIGAVVTLPQIAGVSIYPGVAYPDKNTFGTIGGTIAYESKRPSNDFHIDLDGSVGSFGTDRFGFEVNTGSLDSGLGTGDNAIKFMANYQNLQTNGYIDGTPSRENEFEFAMDKPYNDGLSKFQATVLYNTANGLIENEPVPVPYLQKYGLFSNYPTQDNFARQNNDYLTIILKNSMYINDYVQADTSFFYLHNDNRLEDYSSLLLDTPGGVANFLTVNGAGPFINNPGGFGEGQYLYGPPVGGGLFAGGYGGYFYDPHGEPYNPEKLYPIGSKYCPAAFVNAYYNDGGDAVFSPCGLNDQITGGSSDTYGIQPKFTVSPPDIFGIAQSIKFGGIAAKESSPTGFGYLGGSPGADSPANLTSDELGGSQRTIYQGYAQDKLDFFDNTLHITPGVTVEGTKSSLVNPYEFGSFAAPIYGPNGIKNPNSPCQANPATCNEDQYGYYKAYKWDREWLPFANVTYDFDKLVPTLKGLQAYASYGTSALFAPVGDFLPNTAGPPPGASIVHLYEAGAVYTTDTLFLRANYFYQKVDRDFGFFSFQSGPQEGLTDYNNDGTRETKGVEATATWQVTPDVQLFANGSHILAKYLTSNSAFTTVAEDQYGTAFKGAPETGVPDYISTFGVDYSHKSTFIDSDAVNVRFTGTYTGHQFTTYDLSGNAYLTVPNYNGLAPLTYGGCPGPAPAGANTSGNQCLAYSRYNQITGATVYDPNGGISPFTVFSLDLNYKLPTPQLPVLKQITFDLNVQNLFNAHFWQYYYKQVPPAACGTFTSGPFVGLQKNNYSCTPEFADGIPGQPFSMFFTVTARF
jgi:iron complex outermembrane receptor protein